MRLGLLRVDVGMVNDKQDTAGRDGGQQHALSIVARGAQQCGVLRGHQVERSRLKGRFLEPTVHPPHADSRVTGVALRAFQGHPRYVQRCHVPAPTGQPDRVRTLAAPNLQRPTRREVCDLGDQGPVGLPAP
ncbi:MAG: hypothetical protein QOG76_5158 [Pseudonocardiales bacterium]|nr:hypothetical protein [Pseudonocardiales bacterium]